MEELKKNLIINNRYQLKEYIGSGSFGEVWRAFDKVTKSEMAIKIYISLDKKGCDEFLDEYRIASALKHSNLLVTEAYDVWESRPFLTMRYCSKGSAAALVGKLKPSKDDEREIWKFIHDVAAGLAYLHNTEPDPIVHQDIKPDNVLIDSEGKYLITDFGISKRVRSTLRQQSSRAQKAGAVAYMGPERFSNKPNPILASDVWSLGASIYELAEGELPFAGQGGVMLKNGADMADLGTGWSEALNDLMHKCLAKEPWNRYKAYEIAEVAADVLADFDRFYEEATFLKDAESEFDSRKTVRKFSGQQSDDGQQGGGDISKEGYEEVKKRKPWKWVAIILLALTIAGGGAYYFLADHTSPEVRAAQAGVDSYMEKVEQCEQLIQTGDASNHQALLNAKSLLAEIQELEAEHCDALPEYYDKAEELENQLTPKLRSAAEDWAVAAQAQYENLENYEQAIEFYLLSLALYEDADVRARLDHVRNIQTVGVADSVAVY